MADEDRVRDALTGQFAYGIDGDQSRVCVCGHPLAVHVAGGYQCINGDPCDPRATLEPCGCRKFRPSRRKADVARAAAARP